MITHRKVAAKLAIKRLNLADNQKQALFTAKKKITENFAVHKILIFGSVAREESDAESDLDVLLLTTVPLSHKEKHRIYAIITHINLAYDTNLSVLVVDQASWESDLYAVLPIKREVQRDEVVF
ncbi:nucleotidyltransferase domain-containing protein [candidate division NPL-UPA2 bacterium]|nr:nucleotidyltransferase domain-containing protein [candidate division NPL-UPA2 bacterium]